MDLSFLLVSVHNYRLVFFGRFLLHLAARSFNMLCACSLNLQMDVLKVLIMLSNPLFLYSTFVACDH